MVGTRQRRGRGGTTLPDRDDTPVDGGNTSVPVSEGTATASVQSNSNNDENAQMGSPNSPSSAPTETPAPTPLRAPVQRLDTLRTTGRGAASVGPRSKFKPRAIRRTKDEREQAAREEQARINERAAEEREAAKEERLRPRDDRGRGRGNGGRGRGDAMGKGGLNRAALKEVASGPFAVAPQRVGPGRKAADAQIGSVSKSSFDALSSRDGRGRRTDGGARAGPKNTEKGATNTSIKQEPTLDALSVEDTGPVIKDEFLDPIYPDEDLDGEGRTKKIDIELINLISDDDEDEDPVYSSILKGKGKSSTRSSGLKPVRLYREQHKERVTVLNTEPVQTSDGGPKDDTYNDPDFAEIQAEEFARGDRKQKVQFTRNGKKWPGVWQDDIDPPIKIDPDQAAQDTMDVDDLPSPDIKQNLGELVGEDQTDSIGSSQTEPGDQIEVPKESMKALKDKSANTRKVLERNRKPVLQTEEDKAEYRRHLEDIQILANELGGLQSAMARSEGDADGDIDLEAAGTRDRDGRLYLFQFPPILPPLHNPVKKAEQGSLDIAMLDIAETSTGTLPIDLTTTTTTKADPSEVIDANADAPQPAFRVPVDAVTEAGRIARPFVRQSGKVELDWGDHTLQLSRGADFDFLTASMIVERVGGGGGVLESTCMGKVMGKFVAKPDWTDLLQEGEMVDEGDEVEHAG